MTPGTFTHDVSSSHCNKYSCKFISKREKQKREREKETLGHWIQMYSDIYCGLTAGFLKGNIDVILASYRSSKI